LYRDFFNFEQSYSLLLIVNHKPIITGTDDGIWRRVRLIPWEYRIPEHERRPQEGVVAELVSNGSAVLNWLLQGFRDWHNDPHWIAPEVRAASGSYRAEMDVLSGFLTDCCVLKPRAEVAKGQLYDAYIKWCEEAGEQPVGKKEFGRRLSDRGFGSRRGAHNVHLYVGIGLKVTNGDQSSVNPYAKSNSGDYTENRSPKVTLSAEQKVADSGSISVNPYAKSNSGDYTENVPLSATNATKVVAPSISPDDASALQSMLDGWRVPEIGDLVFLLAEDGTIQNREPWAILDIAYGPDGQSYALFAETSTGWPLERCVPAVPELLW